MSFRVAGFGYHLPGPKIGTAEIAALHGADAAALARAPGVDFRHYAGAETQLDMGVAAAKDALDQADVDISEIDLIVSACAVSYQPIPGLAPLYGRTLGARDGSFEALDINTTCLSFLSAFDLVSSLMWAGRVERVLIISSEMASRGLDWKDDPETAALFGDGAAAMVLVPGSDRIASSRFETHASGWEDCQLASGGTRYDLHAQEAEFRAGSYFRMNGKNLFRLTSKVLPGMVETLLSEAEWTRDDVDLIIPHQASPLGIAHMQKTCKFDASKVMNVVRDTGNMISASVPFCLARSSQDGLLRPGSRILLLGTSAGVNFGGIALELEG